MNGPWYCPDCGRELEVYSGCGSVGYLCDTCKKLISSKRILTGEQIDALRAAAGGAEGSPEADASEPVRES